MGRPLRIGLIAGSAVLLAVIAFGIFLAAEVLTTRYVPDRKLIILNAGVPVPDRQAVELQVKGFIEKYHFQPVEVTSSRNVSFWREPGLMLITSYGPKYATVVLWNDPDDRGTYEPETSYLASVLQPLGFRILDHIPSDD